MMSLIKREFVEIKLFRHEIFR